MISGSAMSPVSRHIVLLMFHFNIVLEGKNEETGVKVAEHSFFTLLLK